MSHSLPSGFKLNGIHSGIKSDANKNDLTLIAADRDCVGAGVYTQNLVVAAPVTLDQQRTPSDQIRGVIINSGNANACTGERGMSDAQEMTSLAAQQIGCQPEQVLVLSTGIIGEFLPMEVLSKGIPEVAKDLGDTVEHIESAAKGMLTTDTYAKIMSRTLSHGNSKINLLGLAKGAAMIGPNMATMLGVILTDANISCEDSQAILKEAVDESFNCLSVEGHTSTNDTVLLLSSGKSTSEPLKGSVLNEFGAMVKEICIELAKSIADDGEGTTHVITIDVSGCENRADAKKIAQTIANGALVKTAIAGADPNWGRIVSAAGYAEVPFDPAKVSLHVQGILLYENGSPVPFDEETASNAIRDHKEVSIELSLGDGEGKIRFWTTDLTQEYVHLNADYHT